MDSVGSEISSKIKGAIRAKLVEMDIYVDDELPDYIMVLVANKKTNKQMEEDLSLFLGNHTAAFVEWLRDVFTRLKSIDGDVTLNSDKSREKVKKSKKEKLNPVTVDDKSSGAHKNKSSATKANVSVVSSPVKSSAPKSIVSMSKVVPPNAKIAEKTSQSDHLKSRETDSINKKRCHVADTSTSIGMVDKPSRKRKSTEEPLSSKKANIEKPLVTPQQVEEAPRKPLSADISMSHQRIKESSRKPSAPRQKAVDSKRKIPADSRDDDVSEQKHPRIKPPPAAAECLVSSVVADSDDVLTLTADEVDFFPKPKSADVDDMPARKSIDSGVLNRQVKGGRAADASKLFKVACKESMESSKPRRAVLSKIGAVVSHEVNDDYDPLKPVVGNVASTIKISERRKLPVKLQPKPTLLLKAMRDAQKSTVASVRPFLVRDNKQLHRADLRNRLKQADISESIHAPSVEIAKEAEVRPGLSSDSKSLRIAVTVRNNAKKIELVDDCSMKGDSRKTLESPSKSVKQALGEIHAELSDDEDGVHVTIGDLAKTPEDAERAIASPSDKSLSPNYVSSLVHQAAREKKAPVASREPTFVVTLTGLGASHPFSKFGSTETAEMNVSQSSSSDYAEEEVVEELEEVVEDAADLRRQLLQQQQLRNKSDGAVPITAPSADNNIDKVLERCRFWPNCKAGADCVYVHPSTPCAAFPKCALGNKCIYIHPPCKFNALCSKLNCPFVHSSSHSAGQTSPGTAVECRFKNNCKNVGCAFSHPRACRYGLACTNRSCTFTHPKPSSINKQQFKWVSKVA